MTTFNKAGENKSNTGMDAQIWQPLNCNVVIKLGVYSRVKSRKLLMLPVPICCDTPLIY